MRFSETGDDAVRSLSSMSTAGTDAVIEPSPYPMSLDSLDVVVVIFGVAMFRPAKTPSISA